MTETTSNAPTSNAPTVRNRGRTRRRSWEIFIAPALILMTLTVFWGVQDFQFLILEDDVSVAGNLRVKSGFTSENAAWAFTTFDNSSWQPLTWLSLMLDAELYGDTAAGRFHITNLLLHLGAVLLLFGAFRCLTGESWPSALVAALFAIHPQHVEPVAWIAERKCVLAAFFGMGSLWAWARYVCYRHKKWYVLAVISFACCLLSDQTLIALPLLLLLLHDWRLDRVQRKSSPAETAVPGKRPDSLESDDGSPSGQQSGLHGRGQTWRRHLSSEILVFLVLSILLGAIVLCGRTEDVKGAELPFADRVGQALAGGVTGLAQTFQTWDPSDFFPPRVDNLAATNVIGAALLLAYVTIAVVALSRRASYWRVGWLWYLATLIPPIVIGPVAVPHVTDSDMYVPQIGLFLVVSWSLFSLAAAFRWGRFVLPAILAPMFVAVLSGSFLRVNSWRDNDAIFANPPVSVRLNHRAQYQRSMELLGRDPPEVDQAIGHLQQALQLNSHDALSHASLGKVYLDENRVDEAARQLRAALLIQPDLAEAHWNLGIICLNSGQPDVAELHFRKVAGLLEFPQADEYLKLAFEYQSPRWQQLRRIEALGGHFKLAGQDPRSPVIMLSLIGTRAGDADLAAWMQFTQLESLDLNGTQVTDDGLIHLNALTGLRTLELNSTGINNDGLVYLKNLNSIQTLALGSTHVDGRGLIHLKGLPNLNSLVLGGAQVTDAGLETLGEFQALRRLNLSRTRISDAGLECLTGIPRLESLDLVGTRVTDAGLAHLKELSALQSLNLFGTDVTGSGLQHLLHMKNLKRLALDDTQVDDAGLEHIASLSKLEVLTLANTRVTDAGLKNLLQLTGLRQLSLGGNLVRDAGVAQLKGLLELEVLDLSSTQVTGSGVDQLRESMPRVAISW